jgi:amino acid efflux transporter
VALLTIVVVVAVAGSASAERASHWTPFAPHGWISVGSAASTLMFSFVGWEAVAPLTTRFANPSRQLPRAVAIALAVTTALYLALATATIGVLGPRAATDVPLTGLLTHVIGTAGPAAAAVAAIVLTVGTTNAYINGAIVMTGELLRAAARPGTSLRGSLRPTPPTRPGRSRASNGQAAPKRLLLSAIAITGLVLLAAYGLHLVSTAVLVTVPTTLFLAVYLGAMTAALRLLRGAARFAALPGALAVLVMLGFCGWALAIPAAVSLAAGRLTRTRTGGWFTSHSTNSCPASPAGHELIASR